MVDGLTAPKPAESAEQRLLKGIMNGQFAVNSNLPGERDLATQLGVTRPTLREALQRLSRDGWLDIQHGKPTRVRDYWREGSLGVLATLAGSGLGQTPEFVGYLLEVRGLLAPAYARQAFQAENGEIITLLSKADALGEDAPAFALYDWELHSLMTQRASNPIFQLLLNGFERLSLQVGERYFTFDACRRHSRAFYSSLRSCTPDKAEEVVRATMQESLALWQRLSKP